MTSLSDRKLLLLDGGLGTTLEDQYNAQFSLQTPLWSSHFLITDPFKLVQAQQAFAEAGADIILTPTYQASNAGFYNTQDDGPEITEADIARYYAMAVRISRGAFQGRPGIVALSLGAYGATLQPSQEYSGEYGDMTEDDLVAWHGYRLAELRPSWPDIDIIAFETLPRLDEIRAVRRLVDTSKPYWISCVFPNGNKLPDGSTIEQVIIAMLGGNRQPYAIGLNCTKVHKIAALIEEFELAAGKLKLSLPRLVVYPDGTNGQAYDTTTQKWIGEEKPGELWHKQVAQIVQEVQSRDCWKGIIVGGCCKTSPEHIANLRKEIDQLRHIK